MIRRIPYPLPQKRQRVRSEIERAPQRIWLRHRKFVRFRAQPAADPAERYLTASEQSVMKRALLASSRLIAEGSVQPAVDDVERARDGHGDDCWYCKEKCSSLAGNPGLWPLLLPLDPERPGYCVAVHNRCVLDHVKRADDAEKELARLRAQPAADDVERARKAIAKVMSPQRWSNLNAGEESRELAEAERLLVAYGQDARRQALEEAAQVVDAATDPEGEYDEISLIHLALDIRALADKPATDTTK